MEKGRDFSKEGQVRLRSVEFSRDLHDERGSQV